jgi:hypothetical protein
MISLCTRKSRNSSNMRSLLANPPDIGLTGSRSSLWLTAYPVRPFASRPAAKKTNEEKLP